MWGHSEQTAVCTPRREARNRPCPHLGLRSQPAGLGTGGVCSLSPQAVALSVTKLLPATTLYHDR